MKNNQQSKIFFTIVLFLLAILPIYIDWLPRYPDPFGYMGNAAYFSGYNWLDCTKQMDSYYGFGYSLLLSVIMKFSPNFILFYKLVLISSALLLCGCFWLFISIGEILFPKTPTKLIEGISFVICIFPSYLFEVNLIIPEIFSIFLSLLSIRLFFHLEQNPSTLLTYVILGLLLPYLCSVHGRNFGLLFACGATLLIRIVFKKCSWKQGLAFFLTGFVGYLCYRYLNNYIISAVYSPNPLNNTASSTFSTILDYMSPMGIARILLTIINQLFYLSGSTLGLYLIGIISMCSEFIIAIRNRIMSKKISPVSYPYTKGYILLSSFLILGLSGTIFSVPKRIDHVFYGRHNEMLEGIFILYGFMFCYSLVKSKKRKNILLFLPSILLFLLLSAITLYRMPNLEIYSIIPRSIIGINLFFNLLVANRELAVLSITGMVLFCFFLYIVLNFLSEQTYSRLVLTLLSIFFLTTAIHAIRQEQKEFETNRQTIFPTLALIEISDQTLTIYAVQANDISDSNIYLLQCLAYDKPVSYQSPEAISSELNNAIDNSSILIYSPYDIGLDYQFTNVFLIADVSPDHSYYVWATGNIYINELSQHGYTLIKRQF